MTTETTAMFEPLDVELTDTDRRDIHAGLVQFVNRQRKAAKELRELEKGTEAEALETEANAIESQLVEPGAVEMELYEHHRPMIKAGLQRLAVLCRTGQGTAKSWGRFDVVQELKCTVKDLDQRLIPMFSEQVELGLDEPQPDSGD